MKRNISIKSRLYFLGIILSLIYIFSSFYVIKELNYIANLTDQLYEHPLHVSNASIQVKLGVVKMQREIKDLLLSQTRFEAEEELETLRELEEVVYDNFDIISKRIFGEEGKKLAKETEKMFRDWKPIRQDIIDQFNTRNIDEAIKISRGTGTDYVDKLERQTTKLEDYSLSIADEFINDARKIRSRQVRNFMTIAIIIIVGIIILTTFINKSILDLIKKLEDPMEDIVKTGKLKKAKVEGSNEIRKMAENFNKLIDKLKYEFWIKDGKNKVAEKLTEESSLKEICDEVINSVSNYIKASKGSLYLFDKEDNILRLESSFAFIQREGLANEYKIGEGIVGQVGKEKKPITIRSIKDEDIIDLGLKKGVPEYIFGYPIEYNKELLGVVLFSMSDTFSNKVLDFLDAIINTISSSIYSNIQTKKMKQLLEETKTANEKVQKEKQKAEMIAEEIEKTNAILEEEQQRVKQQSEELLQANSEMEEQQQQLEQTSNELEIQNKELLRSRRELNDRAKELEESNRYKSHFLANVSHELRTPLNSIILLSKMLLRTEESNLKEHIKEKVKIINEAGRELLRLIDDVLDFSKINAGRMKVEVKSFESTYLVKEMYRNFSAIAEEKNIEFTIDDKFRGVINSDRDKISQIIRNFLSNAFKFTDEGSINFTIDRIDRDLLFEVKDTGIGIPKEKHEMVFEAFKQADSSTSRRFGGTGLGLSISHELADLLDGEIILESSKNSGSKFVLKIPHNFDTSKKAGELTYVKKLEEKSHDKVGLVIDDDVEFQKDISIMMQNLKIKHVSALTGKKGLKYINGKEKFNFILLDLNLPDISGLELLKEIKKNPKIEDIPVYIVSAKKKTSKLDKIGALGYIEKPINDINLLDIISELDKKENISNKSILVVEDQEYQLENIKENLDSLNINIETSKTIKDTKEKINEKEFSVMILDLHLTEGNTLDLCQYMKKNSITLPIIIYTEKPLTEKLELKLRKYTDSIIIKSENSNERLINEIKSILLPYNSKNEILAKKEYNFEEKKVLIVDDDFKNIFVLATILEKSNAITIEAENGKGAIEKIKENDDISLIIIDIMMPIMDGFTAIKKIREDDNGKRIPIIALTAKTLKTDRYKALNSGANAFLTKPVDYDILLDQANKFLKK